MRGACFLQRSSRSAAGSSLALARPCPAGVRAACEYAAEPPAVPSPRNLTTTQRQLAGVVDYVSWWLLGCWTAELLGC